MTKMFSDVFLFVKNSIKFSPRFFIKKGFDLILEQNRTWIYKPRYSYAGQGIHVISVNSDLEPIFKTKVSAGNRVQYIPKSPGYLMQE